MNRFLKKTILFILPLLLWTIVEGLLPITTFTFRHYEAIQFKTNILRSSSYYQNINSTMNAVGDLCHHTDHEILKLETWRSDKLGFRNNQFIQEADILFIGDSFVQGAGLNQEETISNKLVQKLGAKIKIYNMAPSSMSEFDSLIKCGIIQKPKLLVYSIVEREMPPKINLYSEKKARPKEILRSILNVYDLNVFMDKALRRYSADWLRARIIKSKGGGIQSVGNSGMFFLSGISNGHDDGDLNTASEIIISYKKYCDALGIEFLFLPMPDKESVYYELVPFQKQPPYLFELDSILTNYDVATINTLKIYNNYRKENTALLYHTDDTHWNSNATEIIANEIVRMQLKNNYDDSTY